MKTDQFSIAMRVNKNGRVCRSIRGTTIDQQYRSGRVSGAVESATITRVVVFRAVAKDCDNQRRATSR